MSSKTKIVVLHLKELIYTCIFAVLGILFLILLLIMFLPGKSNSPESTDNDDGLYTPGKYTTSLILGNSAVDVEVVVDANNINSIRLVNLDEAVTTMYPLMEPALNDLASQICAKQSMEDISYSDDNKYTAQVLLEAISSALATAEKHPGSTGRSKPRTAQEQETQTEAESESGTEEETRSESEAEMNLIPLENSPAQDEAQPGQGDGTQNETSEQLSSPDGEAPSEGAASPDSPEAPAAAENS